MDIHSCRICSQVMVCHLINEHSNSDQAKLTDINLNKPGRLVTWFYTIHIPHYFNPHIVGLDKISSILAESHTSQQVKLNSDHTFGLWPSLVSTLHVRQWTSLVLLLSATFTIIYHVFSIHLFEFLSFQKRRKFSILWQ